jgi:hypothetical protein
MSCLQFWIQLNITQTIPVYCCGIKVFWGQKLFDFSRRWRVSDFALIPWGLHMNTVPWVWCTVVCNNASYAYLVFMFTIVSWCLFVPFQLQVTPSKAKMRNLLQQSLSFMKCFGYNFHTRMDFLKYACDLYRHFCTLMVGNLEPIFPVVLIHLNVWND